MKSTTATIKDIYKDNPRLCLSAKRYLGLCYKCPEFDKCESRIISKEAKQYFLLKAQLQKSKQAYDKIKKEFKEYTK